MPNNRRLQQESYNPYAAVGGAMGILAAPATTILGLASGPNTNPGRTASLNAKAKEAARIFSTLDPKVFQPDNIYSDKLSPLNNASYQDFRNAIPSNQSHANIRVFGKPNPTLPNELPKLAWTYGEPQAPSPELGSYAQQFNKTEILPNTIQAVTVTPGAAPSRFADKPINNLVDAYVKAKDIVQGGKDKQDRLLAISPRDRTPVDNFLLSDTPSQIYNAQQNFNQAKEALPTQGGYIWGNTEEPQYSYARGNINQKIVVTENPSLYVSRISANPLNEAPYLFTGDVSNDPLVKPLQSNTVLSGPTWGTSNRRSREGDAHFRGDLIETRGELTTGDIQALLKERNLPFEYAVKAPYAGIPNNTQPTFERTYKPEEVLRKNLSVLAEREGLDPYQVIEKFARKVPALGQPSTPPTPGIVGGESIGNPVLAMNENSSYLNRANLASAGLNTEARIAAANRFVNSTVGKLFKTGEANKGLAAGGLSAGLLATALDPAVIDAAAQGNYDQAIIKGGINSAIGAFTGKGIQSGLNLAANAGYLRPAAAVASALPYAGGVLGGLGLVGTGQALDRAYRARTGTNWVTRNQPGARPNIPGPVTTPTIQPRMGTATLNNRQIRVPYGSVAGTKIVGRPWWDQLGSKAKDFANLLNRGSVIGR